MMLMSIPDNQKVRGRPATGITPMQGVRMPPDLLQAVEDWRLTQEDPPSRAEAIRFILRDWLTGQGLLPHRDDPEGVN
jgi:hypothetical protein